MLAIIRCKGAFNLLHTEFDLLSGPTHHLLACNTQWKCTPPTPVGAYILNGRPQRSHRIILLSSSANPFFHLEVRKLKSNFVTYV